MSADETSRSDAALRENEARLRALVAQQERQVRLGKLFGDIGATLTGSAPVGETLQRCAESVAQHLGAPWVLVWQREQGDGHFELRASAGECAPADTIGMRLTPQAGVSAHVAREGSMYVTTDLASDAAVANVQPALQAGCTAFAGFPLRVNGEVQGVLGVYARQALENDVLDTLTAVADSLAIGIERKRFEQRVREQAEALEALNEVGTLLAAELDQQKLVQAITDHTTRFAGAEFGAFFYNLVDDHGESYMLYALSGAPREAFAKFPMPRNTRVFAPTFNGEGVVRVDDITKDARYGLNAPHKGMPAGHLPVRSYLAVPVLSPRGGRVLGGLFFGHSRAGVFTQRSEALVVGVAVQAGIAMDNARLFREAQRLITALERSNRDLDQFAYVASHDLKAPLRGIAKLSQWIEEDLRDRLGPEAREQMSLLRGRVTRLEGLINGILSYSRAGRSREKAQDIDVGKVVEEVIELLAPGPGATIVVPQPLPIMHTERTPLQQVFMNLIGNALKHAQRPDPHIEILTRERPDAWVFSVKDNGPGIAPQFHDQIWGIFQTLEARDKLESTGIGLSVVRKIIEVRGGEVWVESREGAGATFHFTWPIALPTGEAV